MNELRTPRHAGRVLVGPACFLAVASVYLLHFHLSGYNRFYGDAQGYWEFGRLFGRDGHFSLVSYDSPRFGYSLPLFNHGLQVIAAAGGPGELGLVRLSGALLAATLGVVVLPRLARVLFPGAAVGWGRVLLFNALIFIFWRGHFAYPLSDFQALLAASVGLIALLRGTAAMLVVAGIGFGLAANMRPAYLPAAIAALTVAAVLPPPPRTWRRRGLASALVVAGALLVSLPQMTINNHVRGTWSPLVPVAKGQVLVQFRDGLYAQRRETWIETPDAQATKVFYRIPPRWQVVKDESISEITSYRRYASAVLTHPASTAVSYALHVVNGLDVWYPTPYIRDLGDRTLVLSLLQFTLAFAAIALLVLGETRERLGPISWLGMGIFVSPCLFPVTGAGEPRYFLPAHVLVYMLVCFSPALASVRSLRAKSRAAVVATYAAFVSVCLAVSVATDSQVEYVRASSSAATGLSVRDAAPEALFSMPAHRPPRLSSDGTSRNS